MEISARRDTLHGCREGFVPERRRTQVPVQGVEPNPMLSDDLERDLVVFCPPRIRALALMFSSDKELLMRPSIGRRVVPRMGEIHHEEAQDDQDADVAVGEASATVGAPRVLFASVFGGADLVH